MNLSRTEEAVPLTPQAFHILLALAEKPMHGYGIIQQCEVDSGASLYFDKGGTYRALKRLVNSGYIESVSESHGRGSSHLRKYYSLTSLGEQVLEMECDRYRESSILGQHRLRNLKHQAKALNA